MGTESGGSGTGVEGNEKLSSSERLSPHPLPLMESK